jgi:hypothetical protein
MQARTYALALIAASIALLCTVIGTNLYLDPQGIYRGKTLDLSPSANNRYFRLKSYQADADSYDGLFFASSRGHIMPLDDLSRYAGVKFASFSLYGGTMVDHLPVLEYVLRDKAAKSLRLRAVFLLFDADFIGDRPLTNRFVQHTWPPEITGESWARFWWKNLSAIQIDAWKDKSRSMMRTAQFDDTVIAEQVISVDAARNTLINLLRPTIANAQSLGPQREMSAQTQRLEQVSKRRYFAEQFALLERFVTICRAHDVRLIIAISPFRREFTPLDENDLIQVIDKVARLGPLWDFSSSRWLSDRSELWSDRTHFRLQVARMILERIFRIAPPEADVIGVPRGQ